MPGGTLLPHVPLKSRQAFLNTDVCPLCNSPALYKRGQGVGLKP